MTDDPFENAEMRKADLEVDYEDDYMSIIANVNLVLYEQGYGIQFFYDEKNSSESKECYTLKRSTELIQE